MCDPGEGVHDAGEDKERREVAAAAFRPRRAAEHAADAAAPNHRADGSIWKA